MSEELIWVLHELRNVIDECIGAIASAQISDLVWLQASCKEDTMGLIRSGVAKFDLKARGMEFLLEDLGDLADDYIVLNHEKELIRTFNGSYMLCGKCREFLYKDMDIDLILFRCIDGEWDGFWTRLWGHAQCGAQIKLEKRLERLTLQILNKQTLSAQALLCLEYLGLPRDLSWPIIAVAYWLL
jgi:hypothetical protein